MKKLSVLFICISVILSCFLTSCKSDTNTMIDDAIKAISKYWSEIYEEDEIGDGYFEIKNTRVIHIKENDIEEFKDVEYIIEFDIYSDYFGSAPYYSNVGVNNNVVVSKDGSMSVVSHAIDSYRGRTFNNDFSSFIEKTVDYKDKYNCVKDLDE